MSLWLYLINYILLIHLEFIFLRSDRGLIFVFKLQADHLITIAKPCFIPHYFKTSTLFLIFFLFAYSYI